MLAQSALLVLAYQYAGRDTLLCWMARHGHGLPSWSINATDSDLRVEDPEAVLWLRTTAWMLAYGVHVGAPQRYLDIGCGMGCARREQALDPMWLRL